MIKLKLFTKLVIFSIVIFGTFIAASSLLAEDTSQSNRTQSIAELKAMWEKIQNALGMSHWLCLTKPTGLDAFIEKAKAVDDAGILEEATGEKDALATAYTMKCRAQSRCGKMDDLVDTVNSLQNDRLAQYVPYTKHTDDYKAWKTKSDELMTTWKGYAEKVVAALKELSKQKDEFPSDDLKKKLEDLKAKKDKKEEIKDEDKKAVLDEINKFKTDVMLAKGKEVTENAKSMAQMLTDAEKLVTDKTVPTVNGDAEICGLNASSLFDAEKQNEALKEIFGDAGENDYGTPKLVTEADKVFEEFKKIVESANGVFEKDKIDIAEVEEIFKLEEKLEKDELKALKRKSPSESMGSACLLCSGDSTTSSTDTDTDNGTGTGTDTSCDATTGYKPLFDALKDRLDSLGLKIPGADAADEKTAFNNIGMELLNLGKASDIAAKISNDEEGNNKLRGFWFYHWPQGMWKDGAPTCPSFVTSDKGFYQLKYAERMLKEKNTAFKEGTGSFDPFSSCSTDLTGYNLYQNRIYDILGARYIPWSLVRDIGENNPSAEKVKKLLEQWKSSSTTEKPKDTTDGTPNSPLEGED